MPLIAQKGTYQKFVHGIVGLLEEARRNSARAVNSILTATYWEIGRRLVVFDQAGKKRAAYGENLLENLSNELIPRFGKGYSRQNLQQMRQFYLAYPATAICRTLSGKSIGTRIRQTVSGESRISSAKFTFQELSQAFLLSWSHYILLLSVKKDASRQFYETEALRGGWSVRQLDRQINSQFYERTMLSRNKAVMLAKGAKPLKADAVTAEEEIKSPYVLEFLGLKDEYSEADLEGALIKHLELFLLELGGDFTFVARQKRLRLDDEWYRVDLLFFHRRLKCLVLIDLKIGKFTHADAGQMHMYLNYAKEHWTHADENPPVGLILCAKKSVNVAKYALDNLPNKIMAAEYRTALPVEKMLEEELKRTQRMLENRVIATGRKTTAE